MAEVVRPSDLSPLKQPLIEAVINACMRKNVQGSGLTDEWGSCAEGEFRYKVDIEWSSDLHYYVSYPGGQWKMDHTWSPDPDRETGEETPIQDAVLFDATAVYADVETQVSEWIDPWIAGQSPNVFENQINSMANIINQLYVQDEVRVGNQPVTPASGDPTTGVVGPVSDVRDAIADMKSYLGDLEGAAIDALETVYTNDIGLTLSGQRALAAVAGLAIAGEATAWNNTYADLKIFFEQATHDFNEFAKASEGSGQGVRQALTAISGIATIGAGASVAAMPVAGTLTAVAGLASLGAAFWPVEQAYEPSFITLEGGSFDEFFSSFTRSVRAVDMELTRAEWTLAAMCANAIEDYHANPGSYSITKKNADGSAQPNENIDEFLQARLNISPRKMRSVGGMVESVGDHQRALAGVAGGSDGGGNPSAQVSGEWSRGTLVGVQIGSGPQGHFESYAAVVDTLIDLLLMEADTAHRIAEHCLAIALDFTATDDQIETELDVEARKFDSIPIPVVNG